MMVFDSAICILCPQHVENLELLITFKDEPSSAFFAYSGTKLNGLVQISQFVGIYLLIIAIIEVR